MNHTPPMVEPVFQSSARSTDDSRMHSLFQRAILDNDEAAWAWIATSHRPALRKRVQDAGGPRELTEVEVLVTAALARFRQAMTPALFARFGSAAALTGYLASCAAAVVIDIERTTARPARWNEAQADGSRGDAQALWRVVAEEVAHDPLDHIIAHASYVLGLTPQEIAERYPEQFPNPQLVVARRRALLVRLSRRHGENPILD